MTTHYGKGTAQRTCAAADRTGHAMLHTMYGQALRHAAEFYVEYFALDLIMDDEGRCRGVVALNIDDGINPSLFSANMTILATGGYGRTYFSCTSAHICTGDGNAMVLRAGLPLQDMEFVQFHPTGIYPRRLPDHRRLARRRRLSGQFRRRALHGALRAVGQGSGLARRRLARHDHRDPRRPRRRQGKGPHLPASRSSRSGKVLHERLPGIAELARIFADVDVTREPIPVLPTVHYNMGGIATNYHGEALTKKNGNADTVVPGLMALGEAACVSVHGANRLGSNSLIDLVVFGRAAALRCAELLTPGDKQPELPKDSADMSLSRLDKFRNASGGTPTAQLRLNMQKVMQDDCAVFRTGEVLDQGHKLIHDVHDGMADIHVTDRSLIWNSDLIETLELDNLIAQAVVTMDSAQKPHRKPRRACARGLSPIATTRTG